MNTNSTFINRPLLTSRNLRGTKITTSNGTLRHLKIALNRVITVKLNMSRMTLNTLKIQKGRRLLNTFLKMKSIKRRISFTYLRRIRGLNRNTKSMFMPPTKHMMQRDLRMLMAPSQRALTKNTILRTLIISRPTSTSHFSLLVKINNGSENKHSNTRCNRHNGHNNRNTACG